MHSIITVSDVSFEFPNGRELFKHLNFSLDHKIIGLIGPNGIGKTTLAQLMAGEIEPSKGRIHRKNVVTFFHQRQDPPRVSVEDFLSARYAWSETGELLLAGISRQSLCTTLSGGQWMRVRLALVLGDQYLILDEPTNDLDQQGRRVLLSFLSKSQSGVLLISHDREALGLCEGVLELSQRGLSQFGGGWNDYLQAREQERARLNKSLEQARHGRTLILTQRQQQKERQEKRNSRGQRSALKRGDPAILIGARKRRAEITTGQIEVSTLDRANEAVRQIHQSLEQVKVDPVMFADLVGQEIPRQKLIAEAADFNVRLGDRWLYQKNLNFSWRGPIRMAVMGANGSGKSTLLQAILGRPFDTRGEFRIGNLRTLYLDQGCSALDDEKTIFENVRDSAQLTEEEIRNGLARFLFHGESVFQKIKNISGGERLRAALAQGLLACEKPELIILDEPTNNLDMANIEFLENLIRQFCGALIVISHDQVFLDHCQLGGQFNVEGE